MYIWQWRTCAFKHPFPQMHCFPSLVGFTVARKTNALCPKAGWPLLSIENNTNVAFSWLIYDKKKGKTKETIYTVVDNVRSENMTRNNVQHNVNYLTSYTARNASTDHFSWRFQKMPWQRRTWTLNDTTWVRDPGCYGFSDNRSVAVITYSMAPIASV